MEKSGISSFLLGVGVGLGIGMLFAPKAGADTRQLIKDKTGEGTDYLKQRGTDLRDSAGDLLSKSKEALGRQKDTISEAVEAGKQAYRDTINNPPQPATEGTAH